MLIPLEHGKPVRFGPEGSKGVCVTYQEGATIVDVAEQGEDAILVHDETRDDSSLAFMLSRLSHGPYEPTPVGVFRAVARPTYGDGVEAQVVEATSRRGPGELGALLRSGATWEV